MKDNFLLDLSVFENTFLPQEKPIYKIKNSIEKIEKSLHNISK
jgi:hypothetical protein